MMCGLRAVQHLVRHLWLQIGRSCQVQHAIGTCSDISPKPQSCGPWDVASVLFAEYCRQN